MFYTAMLGAAVRTGLRQSMPSSSIDSWARLNETTPLSACGQTKRPRSRRLANSHKPSPSHHSTFTRSPRLPRKTNTCREYGFCSSTVCATALKPVKPRAHVGDAGRDPDARARRQRDHRPSCSRIRRRLSGSTDPSTRMRTRPSSIWIAPEAAPATERSFTVGDSPRESLEIRTGSN